MFFFSLFEKKMFYGSVLYFELSGNIYIYIYSKSFEDCLEYTCATIKGLSFTVKKMSQFLLTNIA
jgi:hypothetical protein